MNLCNNNISKIENLETLTNLSLCDNQINKIENLETLTSLIYLGINNNQISKIENLEKLTKLINLHLENNLIDKIENLEMLTNLLRLYLENNLIDKIENLETLTKLVGFDLNIIKNNKLKISESLHKHDQDIKLSFCEHVANLIKEKFNNYNKNSKIEIISFSYNEIYYTVTHEKYIIKAKITPYYTNLKLFFDSIINNSNRIISDIDLIKEKLSQEIQFENDMHYIVDDENTRHNIITINDIEKLLQTKFKLTHKNLSTKRRLMNSFKKLYNEDDITIKDKVITIKLKYNDELSDIKKLINTDLQKDLIKLIQKQEIDSDIYDL